MRRAIRIAFAALAATALVAGGMAAIGVGKPRGPERMRAGGSAVRVADGDTFTLDGRRIRLVGIDAPERGQSCTGADGRPYDCGQASAGALTRLIGGARPLCRQRYRDPYGRSVATCVVDGRDLGRAMVGEGWAVAYARYSRDYVGDEAAARQARRGVWQGRFERPEAVRAGRRRGQG